MKNQRFRKFDVWNKAMDFIEVIYRTINKFPNKEVYGLTSQLRRAVISIALNIAEGTGAESDNEFNRFLGIALRSSYEMSCGIEIARRLAYCSDIEADKLFKECDELSAMITGLKKKLKAES